mmetsp:Transcript_55369/g.161624  ORF Transcript_55369/g.161624 Transcript_55369/m.161624 type:complete len:267 (-) Transcript_55369:66-866(-)
MGASLPCSAVADCCRRDNPEIHVIRTPDPNGGQVPGVNLDLSEAVAQWKLAKESKDAAQVLDGAVQPQPPAQHTTSTDSTEADAVRALLWDDDDASECVVQPPADLSEDEGAFPVLGGLDEPEHESECREDLAPQEEVATDSGQQSQELPPIPPVPEYDEATMGLAFTFELPDGSVQFVSFGRRRPPLGLGFAKQTPILVHQVKPNSHADELGVKKGWHLLAINDKVLDSKPFKEVMKVLAAESTRIYRRAEDPKGDSSTSKRPAE